MNLKNWCFGAMSLADIARKLNTTPQAVSNWKARDQMPFHVVSTKSNWITIEIQSITSSRQFKF